MMKRGVLQGAGLRLEGYFFFFFFAHFIAIFLYHCAVFLLWILLLRYLLRTRCVDWEAAGCGASRCPCSFSSPAGTFPFSAATPW